MDSLQYLLVVLLIQLAIISHKGCLCSINCFTCSSRNGSDIDCEDPFHAWPYKYTEKCKVPKAGHKGEFPAKFCVKLTGTSSNTQEKLVIRKCALENMESQCGKFKLEEDTLHGCILTCSSDGCNASTTLSSSTALTLALMVLIQLCTSFVPNYESFPYQFSPLSHQRTAKRKTPPAFTALPLSPTLPLISPI